MWRALGFVAKSGASREAVLLARGYATEAVPAKKEVLYLINNPDPDAEAAVKAYLGHLFTGGKIEPTKPDDSLELTAKVEKKYMAAQAVEYGLQTISVPLDYSKADLAPVKRYVSELMQLGKQAGFEDPATEVEVKIAEQAQSAETVKELLSKSKSCMSPELHAALMDAAQQVETATNAAVTLDGSSDGYKKFAEKVKAVASAHGIPWKAIVDSKKSGEGRAQWLQAALVKDAVAELEAMKVDAVSILDKHLGKTAEQVRKEQAATLAAAVRKAESGKNAPWAKQFLADMQRVQWFDACVAENPAAGPKVTA